MGNSPVVLEASAQDFRDLSGRCLQDRHAESQERMSCREHAHSWPYGRVGAGREAKDEALAEMDSLDPEKVAHANLE